MGSLLVRLGQCPVSPKRTPVRPPLSKGNYRGTDRIVPASVRTFLVVWSGQLVSQIGTAMSTFALLIWIYER
jgi:hypothetical protein